MFLILKFNFKVVNNINVIIKDQIMKMYYIN